MHPMISARAFNTPLMIDPRKAAAFMQGFGGRILGDFDMENGEVDAEAMSPATRPLSSLLDGRLDRTIERDPDYAYAVVDGIAVIPITGVLVHRGSWLGKSSGQTSFEGIMAQINAAADDLRVRGIALEIDSYGGEVAGCFDLADRIRAVAEQKPTWAFVGEHAYSAGYAIASQANRVVLPRTGGVGSIGVICMHADFSEALEDDGVKVTLIHAGAHKADGNPYQALPEAVRAEMQAQMEELREIFAETVAAGRKSLLDVEAAKATEAKCFMGQEAVAKGLADQVSNLVGAFDEFASNVNGRASIGRPGNGPFGQKPKGSKSMKDDDKNARVEAEELDDETDQADPDAEQDDDDEPDTDGVGGGESAQAQERNRVAAILTCEEAEGREEQARFFALNTDMSVEQAKAALATAPKSDAGAGPLSRAMEGDDSDVADGAPDDAGGASMASLIRDRFPTAD